MHEKIESLAGGKRAHRVSDTKRTMVGASPTRPAMQEEDGKSGLF